jgi:N-acyl-D-aspartate/D-glutamate deacylase
VHDIVIRNGTVIDGTGAPRRRADVAVEGGRIVEVGDVSGRGKEEIDADGHVVSPGFVDGHTHMDAQVFWDRIGSSSCWHGVTSVVMGNCGFSLAPAAVDERHLVINNLERAEDISRASMEAGIEWTWSDFPSYLDAVDRLPKAINYASNVGHSALRTWAMRERAFDESIATEDDLRVMEQELERAIRAGAIGFTTSRGVHETSDDRPVASRVADWSEISRLVGSMGDLGAGIFEIASESGLTVKCDDLEWRADAHRRMVSLALESHAPVTFGVLALFPGEPSVLLDVIDEVVAHGGRALGQTHCRGVSVVLSFLTQLPFDQLPAWKEIRALPIEGQIAKLRDPATRAMLVDAANRADFRDGVGTEPRRPNYEILEIMDGPTGPYRKLGEIAAARGTDPVDTMIELALERDLDLFFQQPLTVQDPSDLLTLMRAPNTAMTFSDSGAHVSQICDSSIHTHFLGHWVRERQDFTLEEAVRQITAVPAEFWGFEGRGVIAEGNVADLNVFDADTVGPAMPEVVHDLPGGAKRIVQRAHGIAATTVAGVVTLRDGESTGELPGTLLRGPLAAKG